MADSLHAFVQLSEKLITNLQAKQVAIVPAKASRRVALWIRPIKIDVCYDTKKSIDLGDHLTFVACFGKYVSQLKYLLDDVATAQVRRNCALTSSSFELVTKIDA